MALGGGTFVTQNKELPGAYINFISAASANAALSDRGIVTMPLELDWGVDGEIFKVTNEEFKKNSLEVFGYDYTHSKLKGLRDLFLNIQTLYVYKLTSGGQKASNDFAEALYSGVRGNDLKIVIQQNTDDETLFDVSTILETIVELTHKMPTSYIEVTMDYDTIVPNYKSGHATYKMITDYIQEKYNLKVKSTTIAEVKRSLGLEVGEYNKKEGEVNYRKEKITPEKRNAVEEALKHFGVIE